MREIASIEVNDSAGAAHESTITSMMIAKEALAVVRHSGVRGHFEVEVLTVDFTLPLEKFWEVVMAPLLQRKQNVDEAHEITDESTAVMNQQLAKVAIKTTAEGKAIITIDLADMPCCNGGPQWGHAWDCKTLP